MENAIKTNTLVGNGKKMTLKGYYKSLPDPTYPKKEFAAELARRCNVSQATVKNWIMYGFRPFNENDIAIISEMTGIKPEDLWND